MRILISCFIICLCCQSCSNEDKCDLPPPNNFEIGISNSKGVPLIGNVFKQDSFKLYNNTKTLYIQPVRFGGDSTLLSIFYPDIDNGVDYWLELDDSIVDTFNFNFDQNIDQGSCSSFAMNEIKYNSKTYSNLDDEGRFYFTRD